MPGGRGQALPPCLLRLLPAAPSTTGVGRWPGSALPRGVVGVLSRSHAPGTAMA